jgi:hypothetical protein
MKDVALKLLGPVDSVVEVVFRRGTETITLTCDRRLTDIKAASAVLQTVRTLTTVCKENDAKLAKAGFAEKLVYKQADKGQQPEAKPGKESLAEKLCVNVHAMPDALSGACADSC